MMQPKPESEEGYYMAKCSHCNGEGTFTFGYKNIRTEVCWYCNGAGWKSRKMPKKHTADGKRERPIHTQTEYEKEYRDKYGKIAPSETSTYMMFRYRLKAYLLSHRGNVCEGCGDKYRTQKEAMDKLQVHHVVPVKDGGSDEDDNLLLLCHDCHQGKHEHKIWWHKETI